MVLVILRQQSNNTPGTRVGSGFHDRMLAVKSKKKPENQHFMMYKNINVLKNDSFLLVSPKWVKRNECERREKKELKSVITAL